MALLLEFASWRKNFVKMVPPKVVISPSFTRAFSPTAVR
jgi:hypothetical protein